MAHKQGEQQDGGEPADLLTPEAPAGEPTVTKDETTPPEAKAPSTSGAPAPSAGKPADPPAGAKPSAGPKTDPPAKPLPKQQAKHEATLAHLAGETEETTETPAKPDAAAKTKDGAAKPAAVPAAAASDDDLPTDPKKASKAFAEMRRSEKEAKRIAEELKKDAEFTHGFSEVLNKHQAVEDFNVVDDDQLAGVIRIQASINRAEVAAKEGKPPAAADVQQIQRAFEALEPVARQLGIVKPAASSAPATVEPFTGAIPEEFADAIKYGVMTEEKVRKFIAFELSQKAAATKAAAPATPPAATPPAAPPAKSNASKTVLPAAPTRAPARADDADDVLYRGKSQRHLVASGIPAEGLNEHYKANLIPIIINDLIAPSVGKNVDPVQLWLKASPQAKHDYVVEAQKVFADKKKTPPAAPPAKRETPRQPMFQRNFARGPGRNTSVANPKDPKRLSAFMAGDEQE